MLVRIAGWLAALPGLAAIAWAVQSAIRGTEFRVEHLQAFIGGFVMVFFGSVLVVAARQSGLKWFCSQCHQELSDKEDRACLHCMTLLD